MNSAAGFRLKWHRGWEKVVLTMPGAGRLWEEAIPGITASVEFARDPKAAVLKMIKNGELAEVFHYDFETPVSENEKRLETTPSTSKANQTLRGITTWQSNSSKPQGSFELSVTEGHNSKNSAKLLGIEFGCVLHTTPVKPGQVYYISAVSKTSGLAKPNISISW